MNTQNNQENIFDELLVKCRQKRAKAQGFASFLHDKVILDLKHRLNEQRQEFTNTNTPPGAIIIALNIKQIIRHHY